MEREHKLPLSQRLGSVITGPYQPPTDALIFPFRPAPSLCVQGLSLWWCGYTVPGFEVRFRLLRDVDIITRSALHLPIRPNRASCIQANNFLIKEGFDGNWGEVGEHAINASGGSKRFQ